MFTVILVMAVGIALGWLLRQFRLPWLGKTTSFLIWILLFLLGVEVGGDQRIIEGIASLGAEAIVVAVAGVAGCILLSLAQWRWVSSRKESDKK